MMTTPYGAWSSPISAAMLAGAQISYWGLAADAGDVYWGEQAEVFVEATRQNGLPHAYMLVEGEDHFLAKRETVIATRQAELSFYGRLFGFEPAGEIRPVRIENLSEAR